MKRFFVTGTDTGVGKTFVTCALARRAVELKQRVFAFKPIETGCLPVDGQLVGEDQEALCRAAGDWQQGALRGPYRFRRPAAPIVAADAPIDLDLIARVFSSGAANADLVLVEGAGGWRVPIAPSVDMSSLARRLELPVVVVARAGLGTINHSVLTIEAVQRDGLQVSFVLLSLQPDVDADLAASNVELIGSMTGMRVRTFVAADADLVLRLLDL
jgi:dethiobiotin synthetase